MGVGGRADETALDAADTAMEARLRAVGFQKADVSHDLVFASGLVTLRMRADTGPRFEPRFEGNESYDATALSGALGLDEETDLAPGHLVQKVRDFYVKRGFLDVEVTLETRGGERDRIHLLVFHIVENPLVRVSSRAYPCLKLDEIKKLSGGGPRSPSEIGGEIDSFLEEELPGADLVQDPDPRGLDATITAPTSARYATGTRVTPLDLDPDATFAPETYDRAAAHVQELYRNEGYLHAEVGPVLVLRRACDKRSPPGRCIPRALPASPPDECTYDTTNLPLPVAPLDPSFTCVPDPAHGVECEPQVTLRIPVKLGPRTMLYDMQFTGARAVSEVRLARATELVLGEPANALKLEDARRKLVELYKEEGFAFVDVKYTLDSSVDHTRARVRFDIVEGDRVIVRQIVIRGNTRTNDWTIRRRIALEVGKPYGTSRVRRTQERIATLNVFSNISVALEEPYVPQKSKVVIVTVTERNPQSIEVAPGLSTGEGIRGEFDYTHANIGGDAIGFSLRTRLSYLPDVLIFDPIVKSNFDSLCGMGNTTGCFNSLRLAARITGTVTLPEIGFGPLVRATFDGVAVHDLEHDFYLDKFAAIPTVYYRPFRELQFALSQSVEDNDAHIFAFNTIQQYLASVAKGQSGGGDITDLSALLRFPDVPSHAFAQRFVVTWDRRDNTFNPHKGTFFVSGFEHTDWYGEGSGVHTEARHEPRHSLWPHGQVHRDHRGLRAGDQEDHPRRRGAYRRQRSGQSQRPELHDLPRPPLLPRGGSVGEGVPARQHGDAGGRRPHRAGLQQGGERPEQVHHRRRRHPRRQPDDQPEARAPRPGAAAGRHRRLRRRGEHLAGPDLHLPARDPAPLERGDRPPDRDPHRPARVRLRREPIAALLVADEPAAILRGLRRVPLRHRAVLTLRSPTPSPRPRAAPSAARRRALPPPCTRRRRATSPAPRPSAPRARSRA